MRRHAGAKSAPFTQPRPWHAARRVPGAVADTNSSEDTGDFNTPPKPAAPTCTGWLENCLCPRCFNESRETDHGKPIPDTEGVTLMTPRGRRNLHRNNKKRKYGSQPPSPVP